MVRVLQISGNMNMGGQETFIMNVYRNIDRSKIQFDFVVHSKERGYYDDEIEKLGGRIYRITPMTKNIFKHCKELKNVIKKGKYEIIHRHTSSSIVFIDLLIAKICGVKKRIVHSHNNLSKNVILHKIFRPFLNLLSTDKMACSIEAAKWLFGNKYCKCAEVVNNGVELTKFLFNKELRNLTRKKYDVQDNIIIGHVGRFDYQKNHNYILKIFSKVIEKNDKYRLWLVGEGAIKEEIKQKAKEENIEKYIKFFGIVDNVNELLQGMDIFVFPQLLVLNLRMSLTGLLSIFISLVVLLVVFTDAPVALPILTSRTLTGSHSPELILCSSISYSPVFRSTFPSSISAYSLNVPSISLNSKCALSSPSMVR